MKISHSHKFIFIHIYKVAGTSIYEAIGNYAFDPNCLLIDKVLRKLRLHSLPIYRYHNIRWHVKAQEIKYILPVPMYDNYFKFCFVRNPWDWQVSLFHSMLQTPEHFQHKLIKSMSGFDEYIRWRVAPENRVLQKSFVTDRFGSQIVDFVGRYENLEEDFRKVCERVNIIATLPHINKSVHKDYRSYYDADGRELIREHFAQDIEYFGYSFD